MKNHMTLFDMTKASEVECDKTRDTNNDGTKNAYEYHSDSIHCFSLEGISSQSYEGLRESMEIAINYGKSITLARLFFIKVIFNKFLGKLFGFKNLIKLKRLLRYSSNWE